MSYKGSKYGNNKKVVNGIKFDSELELYCYFLLNTLKFNFDFQKQITLIDKFKYNKEAVRAITAIVDFVVYHNGKEIYIDTKGFATEVSKIKYKMLRFQLKDKKNTEVVWLKTKKEVNKFLIDLKEKKDEQHQQSNITW